MKQLKKSFIIVFTLMMVLGNTLSVSANNIDSVLLPYEDRLSEINEELGTNYKLATEDELNAMDNLIDFLQAWIWKNLKIILWNCIMQAKMGEE